MFLSFSRIQVSRWGFAICPRSRPLCVRAALQKTGQKAPAFVAGCMTPCHSPWQDALLSMSLARALGHHGVGCARWTLGSSGLPAEGDVTAIGTLLRLSGNGRAVPEPARDTGDGGHAYQQLRCAQAGGAGGDGHRHAACWRGHTTASGHGRARARCAWATLGPG